MKWMAKEIDSCTPRKKKNPQSRISSTKTHDPIDWCFSTALNKTKQMNKKPKNSQANPKQNRFF